MADGLLPIIQEFEKRWRSRIGTHNPYDASPYDRVGRNELQDFANEQGLTVDLLLQATEFQPYVKRVLRKLRKEFPNERW